VLIPDSQASREETKVWKKIGSTSPIASENAVHCQRSRVTGSLPISPARLEPRNTPILNAHELASMLHPYVDESFPLVTTTSRRNRSCADRQPIPNTCQTHTCPRRRERVESIEEKVDSLSHVGRSRAMGGRTTLTLQGSGKWAWQCFLTMTN